MSKLFLKAIAFMLITAISCFVYSYTTNAFNTYMTKTSKQITAVFNLYK